MDYGAYKKSVRRIRNIQDDIARLSIELIDAENKLEESRKIGFNMEKIDGRKFNKGNLKGPGPGRPKGSKSKRLILWEEVGEYIINEGSGRYLEYLKGLDDKDYADRYEKILEFFRPKQQRSEIKADVQTGPKKIGFKEESESD